MKPPSTPPNESQRLAVLAEYGVLDTPAEANFDAITRLLATALEVPIALISIVDADRQWFKSRYGLETPFTPRDVSFCGHVVSAESSLIIRDACEDERFADNPLVTGNPHVRFYAGAPICTPEGLVLGTLCAIDHEPRELSEKHRELLQMLANHVTALLELRRKEVRLVKKRRALAMHQQFFEMSLELMCTADSMLYFRELNPAWEEALGFSLEELRSRPLTEFVHPDDLPAMLAEVGRLLDYSAKTVNFENRYRHKDGHWVSLSWVAAGKDGNIFATARDISTYRTNQALLAESEARLRTLFGGMSEGMVLQDVSGSITECNAGAERILGLSMDQMTGRQSVDPRWQSIHEDGSPFPGETHPAMVTLRTGEAQTDVVMGVHKPSGELTWVSINSCPLFHDVEKELYGAITTFRDITEQRLRSQLAERYARQERLVTTGTLAAGVGHEINNPLSYVLANLDFALEQLPALGTSMPSTQQRELVEVLGEAREGAERVRRIVRGLRALAREENQPVPTDVHAVVEISVNMAMHEVRQKATVDVNLRAVPLVMADESRLTQVIVNLLMNAAQAFTAHDPTRNRISVRLEKMPERRVAIVIEDNGPGISPEILPRIFDPFFSTKPVGQGTGLGLSISHSIVTALGGEITCNTRLGEGTTFRVTLPVAGDASMMSLKPGAADLARAKILIVDDDIGVLKSTARLLAADHDVVALSDPREAFAQMSSGASFDIVLCDLMMPHINGAALYQAIAAHDAALADRFVFITGGSTGDEMTKFLADCPNERLEKPLDIKNLRAIVRRFADLRSGATPDAASSHWKLAP